MPGLAPWSASSCHCVAECLTPAVSVPHSERQARLTNVHKCALAGLEALLTLGLGERVVGLEVLKLRAILQLTAPRPSRITPVPRSGLGQPAPARMIPSPPGRATQHALTAPARANNGEKKQRAAPHAVARTCMAMVEEWKEAY